MKSHKKKISGLSTALAAFAFGALLPATAAYADIKVGIDLSSTGPAAVIGITSK
ncbi:MAG TPA: branched-chain amino acid ABC transporter substrate-binding protein, partial [Paraburkholderia sp.]|nr:branched-chain amino acid ABC transporter substrate-binding protein [Paraburkholderia sp.]